MKEWDVPGHELCRIQGSLFEESQRHFQGSSAVFIRLFMFSDLAKRFDDGSILFSSSGFSYEELGLASTNGAPRGMGRVRYSANKLYWLGYFYRYWCYTRNLSSRKAFCLLPVSKLVSYYEPLHTQDPEGALRVLQESLGLPKEEDINQKMLAAYREKRKLPS
jgi:hypothetical protein